MGRMCENFTAIAVNADEGNEHLLAHLRCKQWSCSYCAQQNAKIWRAKLLKGINESECNWAFVTITLPSWVHKRKKSERYEIGLKLIQSNWDRFMKRLKREYGKFEYLRVLETHKTGVIHIHLLMGTFIPDSVRKTRKKDGSVYHASKTLKKHLVECGFGYIHDARNLTDSEAHESIDSKAWNAGSVAGYVTKYITKDLTRYDEQRKGLKVRKIQCSQAFIGKDEKESGSKWVMRSPLHASEVIGVNVTWFDVTLQKQVNSDDFTDSDIYPPIDIVNPID